MIDLNKEIVVLVQHQEHKIEQLVKFIWDASANPELLRDQNLMNHLLDMDFSTIVQPTLSQLKDLKIQQLEDRLYSTAEMLDLSRKIINAPIRMTGSDLDTYNKAVDQHVCQWVDADGNPLNKQD